MQAPAAVHAAVHPTPRPRPPADSPANPQAPLRQPHPNPSRKRACPNEGGPAGLVRDPPSGPRTTKPRLQGQEPLGLQTRKRQRPPPRALHDLGYTPSNHDKRHRQSNACSRRLPGGRPDTPLPQRPLTPPIPQNLSRGIPTPAPPRTLPALSGLVPSDTSEDHGPGPQPLADQFLPPPLRRGARPLTPSNPTEHNQSGRPTPPPPAPHTPADRLHPDYLRNPHSAEHFHLPP